jgi:hypothetical protein
MKLNNFYTRTLLLIIGGMISLIGIFINTLIIIIGILMMYFSEILYSQELLRVIGEKQ